MAITPASTVVYLGPEYTFSHEAAKKLFPASRAVQMPSFQEVFSLIQQGGMDYGVLPVENSSTGTISETYQLLLDQPYEPITGEVKVKIVKELYLPVPQHLLAIRSLEVKDIRILFTHRQPQLQCARFISTHLPETKLVITGSTAEAAKRLKEHDEEAIKRAQETGKDTDVMDGAACIGGDILAQESGLTKIRDSIQDLYRNITRFVAISSLHRSEKSRNTKTSFAIVIPDRPGMLVDALQLISSEKINLKGIKTLPVRDSQLFRQEFKDWFVIDVQASETTERFQRFARRLREHTELILGYKMFGSYPVFDSHGSREGARAKKPDTAIGKDESLLRTLAGGELQTVEYKSTLRYDLRQRQVSKELTKAIAKSVAAFMNGAGGVLFVGVDDQKGAVGIELDIQSLKKRDEDGFLSTLYQVVIDMIGNEFCQLIRPTFLDYEDKRICAIEVDSSPKPAWLVDGKEQVFYIRTGNSSRALPPKEALDYVLQRFRSV